jgi:hypothetical protein
MKDGYTPKGYSLDQFEDAFARYLSPEVVVPPQRNDSSQATPIMGSDVAEQAQLETQRGGDENVAAEVSRNTTPTATPETLQNMTCGGVADVAANSEAYEEAF